jgi:hypothetical protein
MSQIDARVRNNSSEYGSAKVSIVSARAAGRLRKPARVHVGRRDLDGGKRRILMNNYRCTNTLQQFSRQLDGAHNFTGVAGAETRDDSVGECDHRLVFNKSAAIETHITEGMFNRHQDIELNRRRG